LPVCRLGLQDSTCIRRVQSRGQEERVTNAYGAWGHLPPVPPPLATPMYELKTLWELSSWGAHHVTLILVQ